MFRTDRADQDRFAEIITTGVTAAEMAASVSGGVMGRS
jgi:hypothetical protein